MDPAGADAAGTDAGCVDRALAAGLAAGMANELDAIFGRIIERLDRPACAKPELRFGEGRHARDQPTAGRA